MIETTTETFKTESDHQPDTLTLRVSHFTDSGFKALSAAENPSMVIDEAILCRPDNENGESAKRLGSIELLTEDRLHAMVVFEPEQYQRLEEWVTEHAGEDHVTIYDSAIERSKASIEKSRRQNKCHGCGDEISKPAITVHRGTAHDLPFCSNACHSDWSLERQP